MFDIVGKRYFYFAISLLAIVPGFVAMAIYWSQSGQPFRLAIDFTGGTVQELKFTKAQPFQASEVVSILGEYGLNPSEILVQPSGNDSLILRTKEIDNDTKLKIQSALRERYGNFVEQRAESVGPAVGAEVTRSAMFAVLIASIFILLYITLAFRKVQTPFRFGVCAIIAVLHDVAIVVGAASLFGLLYGWEVDALFLTAVLTVIGFSVHDTIVVFDRVRENLQRLRGLEFEVVVNHSIIQTLDRSINTVLTTLFVLAALLLFGGVTIQHFVAMMFIGIFSGMYSSIFNAAPLLVVWENGEIGAFFRRLTGGAPA